MQLDRALPLLLALTPLAPAAPARTQDDPLPPYRETIEFRLLAKRGSFADDAVGEGAEVPEAAHALRRLLERPDARAALVELARGPAVGGQLYALAGLRFVDPPEFERLATAWAERSEPVEYMSGCLVSDYPFNELVDALRPKDDPDAYDLAAAVCAWTPPARPAVSIERAVDLLRSPHSADRALARELLAAHGRAAFPTLRALIERGERDERLQAIATCCSMGPRAAELAPALASALASDDDPAVLDAAIRALWEIGLWATRAGVPALWGVLERGAAPAETLLLAYDALRELVSGYALDPAGAPPFVRITRHEDEEEGGWTNYGLTTLPPAATARLLEALAAAEDLERWDYYEHPLELAAPEAFEGLAALLHHERPPTRELAVKLLWSFANRYPARQADVLAAVGPLASGDPDGDVREKAAACVAALRGE